MVEKIKLLKPKEGYKYNEDSIYLANYVDVKDKKSICDLGTGCGIIPILLSIKNSKADICGIEIQENLARIAIENVRMNELQNISIVNADFREYAKVQGRPQFDVVVSNPPYYKINAGRLNIDNEKLIARHEVRCDLDNLICSVVRILKNNGRFYSIYLTERLNEFFHTLRKNHMAIKKIRFIHPNKSCDSRVFLSLSIKGANEGLIVEKPLIIRNSNGKRTKEVEKMMALIY